MRTGLEPARERVAAAARELAERRVVLGTAGNVSERVGGLVAITPTGARLKTLTAAEIAVVELGGEQVDGQLTPTSELELHLGIYRRYETGAVVHTHGPLATALSCVLDELPVVHYQMLALGGAVRVARYATFGTRQLAELTVKALEGRGAALMSNHGSVVHGPSLDVAVERTLLLEWACGIYWHAAALGAPRILGEAEQDAFRAAVAERGYGDYCG